MAISLGAAACGSGPADTAGEASGSFPVRVSATFPQAQQLAQESDMIVTVKNTGGQALPDPAVTITNPQLGTAAQSFGTLLAAPAAGQPILAGRSRPVWVINQPPGPCLYSCKTGNGPGANATAFSDTWALGRTLGPGASATFDWKLTAVRSGSYEVEYQVAAGLSGGAHASGDTSGTFSVKISSHPQAQYVNNAGQVANQN